MKTDSFKQVSRKKSALRSERGSAIVETALSASVLFALLIGMTELFMALYGYHYVAYAAREASRWAVVRGADCASDSSTMPNCGADSADVQTFVQGLDFPGINSNDVTATATWETPTSTTPTSWSACSGSGCNVPGNMVVVDVTYAFPLNIPFVHSINLNLTSTSSMVISQ